MEKTKSREFQENLITSKAFSSEEILVCREGSGSWKAVNLAAIRGRERCLCVPALGSCSACCGPAPGETFRGGAALGGVLA